MEQIKEIIQKLKNSYSESSWPEHDLIRSYVNELYALTKKDDKTCHDPTHGCYPAHYVNGKPDCENCKYYY